MKFKTALRYRVIYQVRSLAIYFGFYALFGILSSYWVALF